MKRGVLLIECILAFAFYIAFLLPVILWSLNLFKESSNALFFLRNATHQYLNETINEKRGFIGITWLLSLSLFSFSLIVVLLSWYQEQNLFHSLYTSELQRIENESECKAIQYIWNYHFNTEINLAEYFPCSSS